MIGCWEEIAMTDLRTSPEAFHIVAIGGKPKDIRNGATEPMCSVWMWIWDGPSKTTVEPEQLGAVALGARLVMTISSQIQATHSEGLSLG